jgi:hypothetical protein
MFSKPFSKSISAPLEAEHFAGAHSSHGQELEHGFVGLPRSRNDFADFLHCEESSFGLDLFGRNGEASVVHHPRRGPNLGLCLSSVSNRQEFESLRPESCQT